jgi:hypothetical protein
MSKPVTRKDPSLIEETICYLLRCIPPSAVAWLMLSLFLFGIKAYCFSNSYFAFRFIVRFRVIYVFYSNVRGMLPR